MPVDSHYLAWVAGFIDGEGTISLTPARTKSDWRVRISVPQNSRGCLDELVENFGGAVILGRPPKAGVRQAWRWQLTGEKTYPVLCGIRQYLRIKGPHADIALQFRQTTRAVTGRRLVSPEHQALRASLFNQMRAVTRPPE